MNLNNFFNKIDRLLIDKNISKTTFYKEVGISSGNFSDWKKGRSKPSVASIGKIASYFDCSKDYLLDNSDKSNEYIIELLNKLNSIGKEKVISKIEELSKNPKYTLENDNINEELSITKDSPVINIEDFKKVKFYNTPVSAGQGSFISDYEDYDIVNVDLKLVPQARRCDFALRIKGDSMEPNYYNGDTVFIKEQPSLDNGQIGIFIYDGEAYIKKYVMNEEGIYLVSLNKKYPPIKVEEYSSFKICGIVL